MPVSSWTDRSGTVAEGGTAQTISDAGTVRRGFSIQNLSDEDLYFNIGAVAVADQPSFLLVAGALYETPPHSSPAGLISVIGGTTGQAFTAKEWA